MHLTKIATLLMIIIHLSGCAVLSKQDCLNANWRQIGYGVALNGNTNKESAFKLRQKACAKHGTTANWLEFQQGHSDGSVQYCQLENAVQLGIKGSTYTIKKQVCPDEDYPGFRKAFDVGYRLHELNKRVHYTATNISNLNSQLYTYQSDLSHIEKKLHSISFDKPEREQLEYERRTLQRYHYELSNEIIQYQRHLDKEQAAADKYADYIYRDYLYSLSDEFIDPR